ncbi:Protein kinase domain-containing protein [Mycena indigotica]|uniref:Protein kinase domain-containing protein n=1 Tax=Mycena indigotica TaxID=2126181 RepID=A0A8H6W5A9_9AGAR|nr:Protein kinase domain-containing protein [Mycena indigotica]KAF7306329.1 Protein kinase domain-containing protein [Mycena indigotica]
MKSTPAPGSYDDYWAARRESEHWWIDHQPFLQSRGYQLRRRYHADWTPSWRLPGAALPMYDCEDSRHGLNRLVLDAIRIEDGSKVVLKRVDTRHVELPIIQYLNSPDRRHHADNRAAPLLDTIPIPDDDNTVLIVMPFLRLFNSPIFRHLREVIDALGQFLQGLVFMHYHSIAHRDVCRLNLMMDASKVVPGGNNFNIPRAEENDLSLHYSWKDRCSVEPVAYYLIDFGLSRYFPEGVEAAASFGRYGQDRTVPEFKWEVPHNPFKVDIYQLGNTFLNVLARFPENRGHLLPLLRSMTADDPNARPTALEALMELEALSVHIPGDELTIPMVYEADGDDSSCSEEEDLDHEITSEDDHELVELGE